MRYYAPGMAQNGPETPQIWDFVQNVMKYPYKRRTRQNGPKTPLNAESIFWAPEGAERADFSSPGWLGLIPAWRGLMVLIPSLRAVAACPVNVAQCADVAPLQDVPTLDGAPCWQCGDPVTVLFSPVAAMIDTWKNVPLFALLGHFQGAICVSYPYIIINKKAVKTLVNGNSAIAVFPFFVAYMRFSAVIVSLYPKNNKRLKTLEKRLKTKIIYNAMIYG